MLSLVKLFQLLFSGRPFFRRLSGRLRPPIRKPLWGTVQGAGGILGRERTVQRTVVEQALGNPLGARFLESKRGGPANCWKRKGQVVCLRGGLQEDCEGLKLIKSRAVPYAYL